MSADEMEERAANILKETGADLCLVKFFFEVRHYAAWKGNQPNFEADINFGVKNTRSEKREIELISSSNKAKIDFLCGEINNIDFAIGGDSRSEELSSGSMRIYQRIFFFLRNTLVLNVDYIDSFAEGCSDYISLPNDFVLNSVREFHWSAELLELLKRSSVMIDEHKVERERRQIAEKSEKAKGKFSF